MPIEPECAKCGHHLQDFGGLLFSPPELDSPRGGVSISRVVKTHLCKRCYDKVERFINNEATE